MPRARRSAPVRRACSLQSTGRNSVRNSHSSSSRLRFFTHRIYHFRSLGAILKLAPMPPHPPLTPAHTPALSPLRGEGDPTTLVALRTLVAAFIGLGRPATAGRGERLSNSKIRRRRLPLPSTGRGPG